MAESDASEELSSDETVKPRPRIESLSDLVFGLALSVGAIALVSSPPANYGQIYSDLASFGFSFLILISTWFSYTRIMSVLSLEDHRTVALNSVLLFLVSVEPFLFNILQRSANYPPMYFEAASQLYAIDLGLMMFVLGLFAWTVAAQEKPPLAHAVRVGFRIEAYDRWLITGMFLVSIVPYFGEVSATLGNVSEPVRVWIWFASLVVILIARRVRLVRVHK